MSERNFGEALKEGERARESQSLSPEAERRIRARAEQQFARRGRSLLPAWFFGVVGVAATAASVIVLIHNPADRQPDLMGFVTTNGADEREVLRVQGDSVVANTRVEIADPEYRVHLIAERGTCVKEDPGGVRVLSGHVDVHVEKRKSGEAPAQVYVSDGVIEILGTRFTIDQSEHGGGQVTLHEGSIRFRAADGREQMMVPGETLKWPLESVAVSPAPIVPGAPAAAANAGAGTVEAPGVGSDVKKKDDASAAPSAPATNATHGPAIASTTPPKSRANETRPAPVPTTNTPPAATATQPQTPDVDALIEEINVLRRRGQFADAASRLESALKSPLPEATSERLSYELGSILTWQLKDTAKACDVWKAHRAAHPGGRYAAEVQRAETSLGCPSH